MSFSEKRPVTEVVAERIWPTILLVGVGTVFATIIGMITGVFAGWRRNGTYDVVSTNLGMVLYAMPTFWFGLLMIMLFATKLRWFPTGRMEEPGVELSGFAAFQSLMKHLFLPAFTFAIAYVGEYHLIMRSSITGVMKEDFALTARAKGLSENSVLWRHVVPNAMLPTVTIVMMNLGFVMSGAILAEAVFNWPGLGLLSYDSMQKRDYPVMQAGVPHRQRRGDRRQPHRRHHVLLPRSKGAGMIPRRGSGTGSSSGRSWSGSSSSCSRIRRTVRITSGLSAR